MKILMMAFSLFYLVPMNEEAPCDTFRNQLYKISNVTHRVNEIGRQVKQHTSKILQANSIRDIHPEVTKIQKSVATIEQHSKWMQSVVSPSFAASQYCYCDYGYSNSGHIRKHAKLASQYAHEAHEYFAKATSTQEKQLAKARIKKAMTLLEAALYEINGIQSKVKRIKEQCF